MHIVHIYSINDIQNGLKCQALQSLGIPFKFVKLPAAAECESLRGLVIFEATENSVHWHRLQDLTLHWDVCHRVETRFESEDLISAKLFELNPTWHHGYPMPDSDNGYIDLTYDTSSGCRICGIGWVQKSPFRMKAEPKWGRRGILQLNWVFDEYFVSPEAYRMIFQPLGVAFREVLHHRTEKPLSTVVQLVVDTVAIENLESARTPDEICPACGIGKYHPHTRGFFPRLPNTPNANIFKTKEYFGSGASAWQAVIVTKEVFKAANEHNLKGVDFYPVAD